MLLSLSSGVPDLLNIAHLKEFENVFPYMSSLYADGHKVESYCGLYNMKLTVCPVYVNMNMKNSSLLYKM